MSLEGARSRSKELSSAFASRDSILSQEWVEPQERQLYFEGVEGGELNTTGSFQSMPEDELFESIFLFPGGPGMP
jgi:hypothetical protein